MSKPRQANPQPRRTFPADDLDALNAIFSTKLAEQDGTNRGVYPVE